MRLSSIMYQIYDKHMNMVDIVDAIDNVESDYSIIVKTDDTLPFYLNALMTKKLSPVLDVIIGTSCLEGIHIWQIVYNKLSKKYRGVNFQTHKISKSFTTIEDLINHLGINRLSL